MEMKNSLEGLNRILSRQKNKSANLKIGELRLPSLRKIRKKE